MKKLCKLFALLLLLALSLSLLTGCHGRLVREGSAAEDLGEEIELPAVPESFDTAKKHEISFWAKNDTNKTQIAIYQKAIRDFEALYPNVTVKLRLYTDYGRTTTTSSPTSPQTQRRTSA